jgi:hypothetical protein
VDRYASWEEYRIPVAHDGVVEKAQRLNNPKLSEPLRMSRRLLPGFSDALRKARRFSFRISLLPDVIREDAGVGGAWFVKRRWMIHACGLEDQDHATDDGLFNFPLRQMGRGK